MDHCSHNRGGETQLGHKHVGTAQFEQQGFFKSRHNFFFLNEAQLQGFGVSPRNVFSTKWKSLDFAFFNHYRCF